MTVELIQGDCIDYMAGCDDAAFDLAIVDPPYGIGEDGSKSATRGTKNYPGKKYKPFYGNDRNPPNKDYFDELKRISKNQIIWGANHFCSIFGGSSSCWLVWDKDNTGNFADAELAYTSFPTAVRIFKFRWNGMMQQNMKQKEKRIHPTQKPVALYRWLLNNYAKPGQRILDTHLGSGSSAIAAHYFGCDFVGIELDEFYYKSACERFAKQTAQLTLF